MSPQRRLLLPLGVALGLLGALALPGAARAEWLVYLGGGAQLIQGPWQVRGAQVVFHSTNGTLLSARLDDVDLPASEFLSWELAEGRRRNEASPLVQAQRGRHDGWPGLPGFVPKGTPCVAARVAEVVAAETLVVTVNGASETVHAACLAAPQSQHAFPVLAWFGQQSRAATASLVHPGDSVCLVEEQPPLRDGLGHRRVYIELADGRDLTAEVIGRGLGLPREAGCSRAARYRALAAEARSDERGHWGPSGTTAALAVLHSAPVLGAGPPLRPGAGGA